MKPSFYRFKKHTPENAELDARKELWISVATAVASSDNATKASSMAFWANAAVDEFDKRFKERKA